MQDQENMQDKEIPVEVPVEEAMASAAEKPACGSKSGRLCWKLCIAIIYIASHPQVCHMSGQQAAGFASFGQSRARSGDRPQRRCVRIG